MVLSELVKYNVVDEHIAILTINRPSAANSLSEILLDELNAKIDLVADNQAIFCTIITGIGENVFCAGADLKERMGMNDRQVIDAVRYIGKTATKIEQMKMPVIAALNGVAFGGGLEIALAADLRISASHVKMGLTETSLAIIPGAGGTQRLMRLIGKGQAKKLIFTAKTLQAEEALRIGLVEDVTENETLMDEALKLAKAIIKNGPIALKQAKLAMNQGAETDLATALHIEELCYKETIPTNDRLEGITAFLEKRKPVYRGE